MAILEGLAGEPLVVREVLELGGGKADLLPSLNNIASSLVALERWDEAAVFYRRSATIAEQVGDKERSATASDRLMDYIEAFTRATLSQG